MLHVPVKKLDHAPVVFHRVGQVHFAVPGVRDAPQFDLPPGFSDHLLQFGDPGVFVEVAVDEQHRCGWNFPGLGQRVAPKEVDSQPYRRTHQCHASQNGSPNPGYLLFVQEFGHGGVQPQRTTIRDDRVKALVGSRCQQSRAPAHGVTHQAHGPTVAGAHKIVSTQHVLNFERADAGEIATAAAVCAEVEHEHVETRVMEDTGVFEVGTNPGGKTMQENDRAWRISGGDPPTVKGQPICRGEVDRTELQPQVGGGERINGVMPAGQPGGKHQAGGQKQDKKEYRGNHRVNCTTDNILVGQSYSFQ